MSTQATPYVAHYNTAREHLAGIAASEQWLKDLTAAHLLRTQQPIRDYPLDDSAEVEQ